MLCCLSGATVCVYIRSGASDNEGKGGSDLASCRASDGAVFYTGIMPAGHESAGPAEITPSLHTAVPALRQQCLDDTSLHPAVDNGGGRFNCLPCCCCCVLFSGTKLCNCFYMFYFIFVEFPNHLISMSVMACA